MSQEDVFSEDVLDLADQLRQLDVKLYLEAGNVRFNAPKGVINDQIITRLKAHKPELIRLLEHIEEVESQINKPISSHDKSRGYPLSYAQQRFWFLDQLAGGNSPIYNMLPIAMYVDGPLNLVALQHALNVLIERHPGLSNKFTIENDEPRQWPGQGGIVPIQHYDLSEHKSPDKELAQIILNEGEHPFNLQKGGPLLRLGLVKLSALRHVMILTMHHIISDGSSLGILVDEFSQLYDASNSNKSANLKPLDIQYGDFAVWERSRLDNSLLQRYLHYWKKDLKGAPTILDLPTDRPRPRHQTYNGRTHAFMIDQELAKKVRICANKHGATPFMVLLSIFGVLLGRYSRQDDLIIGSPLSVRTHPDCDQIIGLFLNTIPLRLDLTESPTFSEVLNRLKRRALNAFEYGEVPFDELLQALNIDRSLNHTPLFQVLFALQNAPVGKLDTGDLTITPMEPENSKAPFDLVLSMEELDEGIRGRFRFNTDLFDLETIRYMSDHFVNLLSDAVSDSDKPVHQLSMAGEVERKKLCALRGTGELFDVTKSISQLIDEQVNRNPENIAVKYQEISCNYRELNQQATDIASKLYSLGVRKTDRVGIFMGRSVDLIATIYAILKLGATYVPLDPAYPSDRIKYMIGDSSVKVVVTDRESANDVPNGSHQKLVLGVIDTVNENKKFPSSHVVDDTLNRDQSNKISLQKGVSVDFKTESASPDDVAYIIYTSGSTGRPKGVEVTNANVVRLFKGTESLFGFSDKDIWTLFHSYAFDFSVWEIFGALLYGGKLIVVPYWISRSPDLFFDLIKHEQVTVLNQTPSAFQQLMEIDRREGGRDTSLKWVIFGGEALDLKNLEGWSNRHGLEKPQLINMYGITETTVHVTYHKITGHDIHQGVSVIGTPLPDLSIDLCDDYGELVPIGVPGEILVGGAGVARGYLNRPELNAQRFAMHALHRDIPADRLYHSGDLARRRMDGTLQYMGRIDQQVKIRGFRIELGEIESQMSAFNGVSAAVVNVRQTESGNELIGYVVFHHEIDSTTHLSGLRDHLKGVLPEYMVPNAIIILDQLPLTTNGKVDKNALPNPDRDLRLIQKEFVSPVTSLEKMISEIWSDILQIEKIGLTDNFFDLGGDSIKGAIFANRMQQKIGSIFYVVALFEAPTITELVDYMHSHYPESIRMFDDEQISDRSTDRKIEHADLLTLRETITPLRPFNNFKSKKRNPKAIFVLAPPRSGTTLLRVLLGGHSKLFAPPELELMPFNTLGERKEICSGRDAFWLEGVLRAVMELHDMDADAAKEFMNEREMSDLSVKDFYSELQSWTDDRILVDKSPSYVLDKSILERIEATFEDPLYIHLHRHPLGMVNSFVEAKLDQIFFRYPHSFSTQQLAELIWLHSHQNISDFFESVPEDRKMRISFEEMTSSSEEQVRRLCDFIGLDFEANMLAIYEANEKKRRMTDGIHKESTMLGDVKFHTHQGINSDAATRWKEHLSEAMLGDITRDMAINLGYKLSGESNRPSVSAPQKINGSAITAQKSQNKQDTANPDQISLSLAQQRLWFFDQLEGASNTYNMPVAIWLNGNLNLSALIKSIATITQRHEVLRSTFSESCGIPYCTISDSLPPSSIVDLTLLSADQRTKETIRWLNDFSNTTFDLKKGPLFRSAIVKIDENSHLLLINMHHIVSDGWSIGLVGKELEEFYNLFISKAIGNEIVSGSEYKQLLNHYKIAPLKAKYRDYTEWQNQLIKNGELERQLTYWKSELSDIPSLLEIPTDHPRPAIKTYKGKTHSFSIDTELHQRLKNIAKLTNTTPYMVLLSVFGVILNRYTHQTVIPIGSPVANRKKTEFESLFGFFVNTLVMRLEVKDNQAFGDLLKQVRNTALQAYHHQDISFEQLVEEIQPERNMGFTPLFQVMLSMQSSKITLPKLGDLEVQLAEHKNEIAKYDLTLLFAEESDSLTCYMEYSTDIFAEWRIKQLGEHFLTVLDQVSNDISTPINQVNLLNEQSLQRITKDWNRTEVNHDYDTSIVELIRHQVELNGGKIALKCENTEITYLQLEQRSNQLAHFILSTGIEPGSLVAVALERSTDMVISLLAILKSGCAYIPLDPTYPANRIEMIFEDADVRGLITTTSLHKSMPSCETVIQIDKLMNPVNGFQDGTHLSGDSAISIHDESIIQNPPEISIDPNQLAYVIFTSGSTGRPKGVMISHKALLNFILSIQKKPGISPSDEILAVSTIAFDIAVLEIWVPLITGASIYIAVENEIKNGQLLVEIMTSHPISILQATPTTWKLLIETGWNGSPDLICLCGGEAMPKQLALELNSRCREVWNMYGPTETTVYSSVYDVKEIDPQEDPIVPIGQPIDNTSIYILDDLLKPLPIGVPGELYIGGDGVALGYLNRLDLTNDRFITDPFRINRKMYRTGDLARYRPNGMIEYIGRSDQQIKLRGYRIELGEIEFHLQEHPEIKQCAATLIGSGAYAQLVSFYIPVDSTKRIPDSILAEYLRKVLPDYMVPTHHIAVKQFPLTPNGKLDRNKLALTEINIEAGSDTDKVQARDIIEYKLVKIWQEILRIKSISVLDNFFEIGGHSLIAVRLMSSITSEFDQHLPLATIFQYPTIAELAKSLSKNSLDNKWGALVPMQKGKSDVPAVFCLPGAGGNILYMQSLVRELNEDLPIFGLQPPGLDGESQVYKSVESLAQYYIDSIKKSSPDGPYRIVGHSFGGLVAFEIARKLKQAGEPVENVVILDTAAPQWFEPTGLDWTHAQWLTQVANIASHQYGIPLNLSIENFEQCESNDDQLKMFFDELIHKGIFPSGAHINQLSGFMNVYRSNLQMQYQPVDKPVDLDLVIIRSSELQPELLTDEKALLVRKEPDLGWGLWVNKKPQVIETPGDHLTMLNPPHVQQLAIHLNRILKVSPS